MSVKGKKVTGAVLISRDLISDDCLHSTKIFHFVQVFACALFNDRNIHSYLRQTDRSRNICILSDPNASFADFVNIQTYVLQCDTLKLH